MRIGIDARLWNESGVGRYTKNLVKHLLLLDKKNSYILFVLPRDKEDIKYQISKIKNNWKLISADVRWHTLEEQLKFPSIINKENLDLMHFPYFSVPIFYNKPYVVTIHDLILHHFPTGLASTLPFYLYRLKLLGYKFVIKRAAQNAKKIITVSKTTKNEIVDHLGVSPDKVVVTYEGIEKSKVKSQKSKVPFDSAQGRQVKSQKYFLFVGNAYPHKNLDRLVETFEILRSAQNDIKLVLVGKEDFFYKRLKEKVKRMNLENSVKFLGEVDDEELGELYKNALALVVPSLMEGFGLPGLEAMANGCLVLASNIPSLKEIYSNAAVYFDPYDVKDLIRKMDVIIGDAGSSTRLAEASAKRTSMTKRSMIEKGMERVKFFSWEKMAKETLRIYESCR